MTEQELKGVIHSHPDIMGGTPVFVGTRVPLQNLIDSLEGGESVIFQQQLSNLDISVLVLHAGSTQLRHTIPLMPKVLDVLPTTKPAELIQIA